WPSCSSRNLQRGEMIFQNLRHLLRRDAAEAAIGGKAELRQRTARGGKALLEVRHRMNEPEIDAGGADLEALERRIEVVVGAVECRDVHPVHAPAGGGDRGVDEIDGAAEILRLEARPAAEGAEAEVEAECDLIRQFLRQPPDRRDMHRDVALAGND